MGVHICMCLVLFHSCDSCESYIIIYGQKSIMLTIRS